MGTTVWWLCVWQLKAQRGWFQKKTWCLPKRWFWDTVCLADAGSSWNNQCTECHLVGTEICNRCLVWGIAKNSSTLLRASQNTGALLTVGAANAPMDLWRSYNSPRIPCRAHETRMTQTRTSSILLKRETEKQNSVRMNHFRDINSSKEMYSRIALPSVFNLDIVIFYCLSMRPGVQYRNTRDQMTLGSPDEKCHHLPTNACQVRLRANKGQRIILTIWGLHCVDPPPQWNFQNHIHCCASEIIQSVSRISRTFADWRRKLFSFRASNFNPRLVFLPSKTLCTKDVREKAASSGLKTRDTEFTSFGLKRSHDSSPNTAMARKFGTGEKRAQKWRKKSIHLRNFASRTKKQITCSVPRP